MKQTERCHKGKCWKNHRTKNKKEKRSGGMMRLSKRWKKEVEECQCGNRKTEVCTKNKNKQPDSKDHR